MSRRVGRQNRRIQGVTAAAVPAFGPSTISSNVVYLMGDSGASVSQWTDQSPGTLGNWTQASGINQPSLTTISGVTALNFPGVAASSTVTYLTGPSLSSLTAAHAFVVAVASTGDSLGHGMWQFGTGIAGGDELMPWSSGQVFENFGSTTRQTTSYTLPAGALVLEFISTSTEWTMKVNGSQVYTTATNTVGFHPLGTLLGCSNSSNASIGPDPAYPFNGKLGAVLVYSRKLTSGEATTAVAALRSKFAI